MQYDHTFYNEISALVKRLESYKNIYIYGSAVKQLMLYRLLEICKLPVKGFVVSKLCDKAF
jgi:hypothetical protein